VQDKQKESPVRIVAIEDNAADLMLLRHAFDELGEKYLLHVLPDGGAALRYLREYCSVSAPEPCLIILDLHVPKYDGLTLLKEIQANEDLAHIPVAVVTTIASPSEKARILQSGVSFYRTKPMEWDDTLELARELFDLCRRSREALV